MPKARALSQANSLAASVRPIGAAGQHTSWAEWPELLALQVDAAEFWQAAALVLPSGYDPSADAGELPTYADLMRPVLEHGNGDGVGDGDGSISEEVGDGAGTSAAASEDGLSDGVAYASTQV